jgi:hypothetical protein
MIGSTTGSEVAFTPLLSLPGLTRQSKSAAQGADANLGYWVSTLRVGAR